MSAHPGGQYSPDSIARCKKDAVIPCGAVTPKTTTKRKSPSWLRNRSMAKAVRPHSEAERLSDFSSG